MGNEHAKPMAPHDENELWSDVDEFSNHQRVGLVSFRDNNDLSGLQG